MRHLLLYCIPLLLVQCSSNEPEEETVTGNVMEVPPDQSEMDAIAMENQPEVIQDFFTVKPVVFGDRYCYDTEEIQQLVLNGVVTENGWSKYEVSDNYLTFYNSICGVMLEFMTYTVNEKKFAFLSQMNEGQQYFTCLNWNPEKEKWVENTRFPRPKMTDYFKNLTASETEIVEEYGYDFVYINPGGKSCTFLFSEWAMELNMGEKELLTFDRKPQYTFDLKATQKGLKLSSDELYEQAKETEKYVVAYHTSEEIDPEFSEKYQKVINGLSQHEPDHQLYTSGDNEGIVIFEETSFDLSFLEEGKQKNGFWLFQEGKEPIALEAFYAVESILNMANAYFE